MGEMTSPLQNIMIKRLTPIFLSTLAFLLGWYLLTRYSGIPNFILPSPLSVWTRFLKAVNDGSLIYHMSITLLEIVLGLLAGVLFATIVGYVLAKSRSLEKVLSPYIVASQAIPIIAIAPLLVIWLGDGILSKVVICALIVFFPVLVNTIVGVRAVPTALYDLMNSLHATRAQILWKVKYLHPCLCSSVVCGSVQRCLLLERSLVNSSTRRKVSVFCCSWEIFNTTRQWCSWLCSC
jgi:NitT/TauT family transport system permease protein